MSFAKRPIGIIRIVNVVFLLVGVVALLWMMRTIGFADVSQMVGSVRAWAVPIITISVTEVLLNAAAIHVFMRPEQGMVSYWRVLAAQLSGQAVNSVTPTGTLGEVVKITMLMGHAPRYRSVSSVVAYNLSNILASISFLLFALLVSLLSGSLPAQLQTIMTITFAVLLAITIGVLYMVSHGMIRSIAAIARGARIVSPKWRDSVAQKLEAFDDQLRLFGGKREANRTLGFVLVGASRIIGWFDLWLILYALGYSQGFVFVVMAAGAGMVIGTLATVIPLGIGADEGGQAVLFELLGLGSIVGLSVSLIRRVRTVVVAGLGFAVMLGMQVYDQAVYRRASNNLRERAAERQRSSDDAATP